MTKYIVTLDGCDDSTVTAVDLSVSGAHFLAELAAKINDRSDCGCKPTMRVILREDADSWLIENADETIEASA